MSQLCVSSVRRTVLVSALSQWLTVRSVHVSSFQLLPYAGRSGLPPLSRCLQNGPHSHHSWVRAHRSTFNHRGSDSKDSDLSLATVADGIKEGLYRRILVMVGAGISTDSGIPDFRSPSSGLYSKLQEYSLPYPEAIFDLSYFLREPHAFLQLCQELLPGRHHPNPAHYFLRLLNDKRVLLRVYTQNIDGLERVAGIPVEKLVEAHGSFSSSTCTMCLKEYPGKTFSVEPFASLVYTVTRSTPRVLINRDPVGPFMSNSDGLNVLELGEVTSAVKRFVQLLGWEHELAELERSDKEP
ncbi:NAD-dependent protein deacetylase sirtuin-3-like isoform X2 [Pseudophryne corroboree]|uniref:NAD-dependent protein deacetylase sirtuin-3-like isoform X2 n=1 Tax=Pseudophryne corroboree TaxID=495146 RepID=UPI003081B39D